MTDDTALRRAEAMTRTARQHAHRVDAELAETRALQLRAEADAAAADARAARTHTESVAAWDAVAELRAVWKRWFEDTHAGLSFRDAMLGIAVDLDRVIAIADEQQPSPGDAAWHTVWLEGKWRWITSRMSTAEREHAADAVARHNAVLAAHDGEPGRGEPEDLRWWRQ